MKHSFFCSQSFNKAFTVVNVTDEEIRTALRVAFPKWSDKVIEFHLSNEGNFAPPKYNVESIDIIRKQIVQRGTPLNAFFRLVKSYDAYYRNGYRQWGNNGKRVIDILSTEFLRFNNALRHYKEATSERQMGNAIAELIVAVNNLAIATERKCKNLKFERVECVDGCGRRLGIIELAERVPLVLANIAL